MKLIRFEPWSIADCIQRDLGQLACRRSKAGTVTRAVDWSPAIDIVEEKARFVLRADLPGINPEDVDLVVDDGCLVISGERQAGDRSDVEGIERYERRTGRFRRRLTLPETADAEAIVAKSNYGTLEISIPKLPGALPRRIDVEAA